MTVPQERIKHIRPCDVIQKQSMLNPFPCTCVSLCCQASMVSVHQAILDIYPALCFGLFLAENVVGVCPLVVHVCVLASLRACTIIIQKSLYDDFCRSSIETPEGKVNGKFPATFAPQCGSVSLHGPGGVMLLPWLLFADL